MYAIVVIAGKQFKVSEKKVIRVPHLQRDLGATVEYTKVMLLSKDGKTTVGTPVVDGSKVTATIVKHDRENKIIVFKMKRRKGYRKKQGHRQGFTLIQIKSIA